MASREPATGTATSVLKVFLFTDLVDSTAWKNTLGDRDYALQVLAPHDRLFRTLLADYPRASLNNDMGDGYLATFPTPGEAVQFALRFHAALAAEPWGDAVRGSGRLPATRVGIHLGEHVELEQPGTPKLSGQAVDLTARLMGLARPGQTLLTRHAFDSARQYVRGNPTDAARPLAFVAHGLYRFKGNDDDPLEVFGVAPDGSPELAPPADSEKARRVQVDAADDTGAWRPAVGLAIPGRDGWRLERSLGDGGFGEVWLARHPRTKDQRVFKFCFDADRLRSFKRELTLFRLLQSEFGSRPDFVRLYDVQFDRPPYFLESEYVAGGNLADWVAARGFDAWPVADRIRFVAAVARTVAAAHSLGIIHKDLKPANLLVREEGGLPQPVVADFGIGVLTDRSILGRRQITATGGTQTLAGNESSRTGTRLYAPPEALVGKPATTGYDVYALGVILYQALVGDLGLPLGTGWEEDLRQLSHADLLADDIRHATLPADRRLGTATLLAERLESLSERERRLGLERRAAEQTRRAAEQTRRVRVLKRALMGAAVVLALMGGVVAYAWHKGGEAVEAKVVAEAATKDAKAKKKDAEDAASREEQEKLKAIGARNELKDANAKLNGLLAKALLGPIAAGDPWDPLTTYEIETFWQLAQDRGKEVPTIFLEEATRTPAACKQLECRAEFAFHAAIGLDRKRRDAAIRLLAIRLQDTKPAGQRLSMALAISRGNVGSAESSRIAADLLINEVGKRKAARRRDELAQGVLELTSTMTPADASKTFSAAVLGTANGFMGEHVDERESYLLAKQISAIASRMPPSDRQRACASSAMVLTAALSKATVMEERTSLVRGLQVLTEWMEPVEGMGVLESAIANERNRNHKEMLITEYINLSAKVDLARTGEYAIGLLRDENRYVGKDVLARALHRMAVRMDTEAGIQLLTKARLADPESSDSDELATGLCALALRMPPSSGSRVLNHWLADVKRASASAILAKGAASVASRAERTEAEQLAAQTADIVLRNLTDHQHNFGYPDIAVALSGVVGHMEPNAGSKACERAVEAISTVMIRSQTANRDAQMRILWAMSISSLAVRMTPQRGMEEIRRILHGESVREVRRELASGLVTVCKTADSQEAIRLLSTSIDSERDAFTCLHLAEGLSRGLYRPNVPDHISACKKSAVRLTELLGKTVGKGSHNSEDCKLLAIAVSSLAGVMSEDDATKACYPMASMLVDIYKNDKYQSSKMDYTDAIVTLATMMEPSAQAALLKRIENESSEVYIRSQISQSLARSARFSVASNSIHQLLERLRTESHPNAQLDLVRRLVRLSRQLTPSESNRLLSEVLSNSRGYLDRLEIADGMSTLAARMDEKDAAKLGITAAIVIIETTLGHDSSWPLQNIALGLPVGSRRLSGEVGPLAVGTFANPSNFFSSLSLLHPEFYPQPRPLPPQALVELLKHPFCIGESRRAVLDALEFTYRRPFRDQWDFVEYAQTHQPQLDLLSPPTRPQQ